jgi:hypothetical protein
MCESLAEQLTALCSVDQILKDRIGKTAGDEDKQTEHDLCQALSEQLSSQAQRTDK